MFSEKYSKKVLNNIRNLERSNPKIELLIKELDNKGEVILIGGAVRDILYNRKPRDYDFVINTYGEELDLTLTGIDIKRNNFGGYKVNIDNITFDIWALKDTWAFNNEDEQFNGSKEDLSKSCFFNLDSIWFDFKENKLIADNFEKGINNKILDIIYEPNLYPEVCVIRAMILKNKFNLKFSRDLSAYINSWIKSNNDYIDKLILAQRRHYKEIFLEENILEQELKCV